MRAQFNGQYRNSKGNIVFRYIVSGSVKEIEAFTLAQGAFYRENENKQPMWFSSRFEGKSVNLIVTTKGRVVADNATIDTLTNVTNNMQSGVLQNAFAGLAAAQIMTSLGFGAPAPTPQPVVAATPAPAAPVPTEEEITVDNENTEIDPD